jgi:DNA-binding MarR family transcriptional regulator
MWRVFIECAFALIDILDRELQEEGGAEAGWSLRWYDLLAHLDMAPEGLPMNELASQILANKSGLTRVVDRMEEAGLVGRERPRADRRVVRVFVTREGLDALAAARAVHHRGIQEHFFRHLQRRDVEALRPPLEKVRDHLQPLRPGRVSR